jgi:hypothetical protein
MARWQLVVADLQAAGLPDPCQGPFHHPADLAQAAAMRRPWPGQVVLDAPLLEPLPVPLSPVRPVSIQGLRLPSRPPAPAADRRFLRSHDALGDRDQHAQEHLERDFSGIGICFSAWPNHETVAPIYTLHAVVQPGPRT